LVSTSGIVDQTLSSKKGSVTVNNNASVVLKGGFETVQVNGQGSTVKVVGGSIDTLNVNDTSSNTTVEVDADSTVASIAVNNDVSISGTGVITNVTVAKADVNVDLQAKSVGTVLVSKEAVGSKVSISSATTVANLNINAAVAVSGAGKITNANIGANGTTIAITPVVTAVTAGVSAVVNGSTKDSSNSEVITSVPVDGGTPTPVIPVTPTTPTTPVRPRVSVANVSVTNATTVTFSSVVVGATIKWNGVAQTTQTISGTNTITVPLMVSGDNNTLVVLKNGYIAYTKSNVIYTESYDTIATLGAWDQDRTQPKSWIEADGWITNTTSSQQDSNSWYDWQGRGAVTNVGLTDKWKVETQIELTEELLNGTGVRTSLWIQVDGIGGAPNTQDNVLDWAILQYKNDPESTKGWESWNSDTGYWVPIQGLTAEGTYTLTMIYDAGTMSQYINGLLVRKYSIVTDVDFDSVSAPSCLIVQSRTFGEEYTVKWKVPTVSYVNKYPVGAKFISTNDQLTAAINSQADGQTWIIKDREYSIPRFDNITVSGQSGWYFPITANNITIIGESKEGTIITSDTPSPNGSWASQDHISVWGDNVTIENLTIKPKIETNKAIEVMGKNFTLRKVNFVQREDQTYNFAGSLFFNPQNETKDIGTALVDNVFINDAWISCGTTYVSNGTLTLKDTTIDFRGSEYASAYGGYGTISKNDTVIRVADNSFFKVLVDNTHASLQENVINRMPVGGTVELAEGTYYVLQDLIQPTGVILDKTGANIQVMPVGTILVRNVTELNAALTGDATTIHLAAGIYELVEQLKITKPINIKGNGVVIIKATEGIWATDQNPRKNLVGINGVTGLVKLENLTFTNAKRSGINIFESNNVVLKDIISKDNVAGGLVVNNSVVVADNLNTSGNLWGYGVNVDNGSNPTTGAPTTSFTLNGGTISEDKQIVSDDGGVIIVAPGYSILINDANKVLGANITGWYGNNNTYLDTSVNFDFDKIRISDIDSVKFSLYQDDTLLGTRLSTGANFITLLKDCAQYWGKTADTYSTITGNRVMSAAFMNRTEGSDNGFWASSICTATSASLPNGLVVEVVVDNVTYITTYAK
jgi:hypothetical protein